MDRLDEFHLHIPIRNPLHVCYSWCRRRHDEEQMVRSYKSMFDFLALPEDTCPRKLYRMENYEPLDGYNEERYRLAPNQTVQARWKSLLLNQVVFPHFDFFLTFYPELEKLTHAEKA
jgi:hypothetical protein